MDWFIIGALALVAPFVWLLCVWFISWFVFATFGKMSITHVILAGAIQVLTLFALSFGLWTQGLFDPWVCLGFAVWLSVLCVTFTFLKWCRSRGSGAVDAEKYLIKTEVDMIPTQIFRIVAVYLQNIKQLVMASIDILVAGGYGSIVFAVVLAVVLVFVAVALVMYFGSLGFVDLVSLSQNRFFSKTLEALNLELPIVGDEFDLGLTTLDRVWTWGLNIVSEALHGAYQVLRILYTIVVPMLNVNAIFCREVILKFTKTIYDCGAEAFRGSASSDGTVAGFVTQTGDHFVNATTSIFDALKSEAPIVRGRQTNVPVPRWMHDDWRFDVDPYVRTVQQGLLVGRDFAICSCDSPGIHELIHLLWFTTFEPSVSTLAIAAQHFTDAIVALIKIPTNVFVLGEFFGDAIFASFMSFLRGAFESAALVDQMISVAVVGVTNMVNDVLREFSLSPLVAFEESLPTHGLLSIHMIPFSWYAFVLEIFVAAFAVFWELVQMLITDFIPGYRTEAYAASRRLLIMSHFELADSSAFLRETIGEGIYFLYYVNDKVRLVLTGAGTSSPKPFDALNLDACAEALHDSQPYTFQLGCASLSYLHGIFHAPGAVIKFIIGLLSITANLDGEITTFKDWTHEIGAFVERSAWIPDNSSTVVVVEHETRRVWHHDGEIFLSTSRWIFDKSDGSIHDGKYPQPHYLLPNRSVTLTRPSGVSWTLNSSHCCESGTGVCLGDLSYHSGELVAADGRRLLARSPTETVMLHVNQSKWVFTRDETVVSLDRSCHWTSANPLNPVTCATTNGEPPVRFERSGWARDEINIKLVLPTTPPRAYEVGISGNQLMLNSHATNHEDPCKARRFKRGYVDDTDDRPLLDIENNPPCTYFTVSVTPRRFADVSILDDALLPVIQGSEHAKRAMRDVAVEYPAVAILVPLPNFLASVPQFWAEVARAMTRAGALGLSTLLGKQPMFTHAGDIVDFSVPFDCEWGVRGTTSDYVAAQGSCYETKAAIQKYPFAEALAYGHTPWVFEHLRHGWARGLILQDVYMAIEKSFASLYGVNRIYNSVNDHAREILQRPFVHMEFHTEYSHGTGVAPINICPAYYCETYDCSWYLSAQALTDLAQWSFRTLDPTNRDNALDLVPIICTMTRLDFAVGSNLAQLFIGIEDALEINILNSDTVSLTRGFAAVGRFVNIPLIYWQHTFNWAFSIIDPKEADLTETALTFDGIKHGVTTAIEAYTQETLELLFDIFEGVTHTGPLKGLNDALMTMRPVVALYTQHVEDGVADLLSFGVRVSGGFVLAIVDDASLVISSSASGAVEDFMSEICWYGVHLADSNDTGIPCSEVNWGTPDDPFGMWYNYLKDRVDHLFLEYGAEFGSVFIQLGKTVFCDVVGPDLCDFVHREFLSCEAPLGNAAINLLRALPNAADDLDNALSVVLNKTVAPSINFLFETIETVEDAFAQAIQWIFSEFGGSIQGVSDAITTPFGFVAGHLHGTIVSFLASPIDGIKNDMTSATTGVVNSLISAEQTVIDAVNSIFDNFDNVRTDLVKQWENALESLIITPAEIQASTTNTNFFSVEPAGIHIHNNHEGDVVFGEISLFKNLLFRQVIDGGYEADVPGAEFTSDPFEYSAHGGVRLENFIPYLIDDLVQDVADGSRPNNYSTYTLRYKNEELRAENSIYQKVLDGAEYLHTLIAGNCNATDNSTYSLGNRRRLLGAPAPDDIWGSVVDVARRYVESGLLSKRVPCDKKIIFDVRMRTPTPWSHATTECLWRRVSADLHLRRLNSSLDPRVLYDDHTWWKHVFDAFLHAARHPDLPQILAHHTKRKFSGKRLLRDYFESPEGASRFRRSNARALREIKGGAPVSVSRGMMHPHLRRVVDTVRRPVKRAPARTDWDHVYPFRPSNGLRRLLSVGTVAADISTVCLKCAWIDDIWQAIEETFRLTVETYDGTTLPDGTVVDGFVKRIEDVADDILIDTEVSLRYPVGFPLLKRTSSIRGDHHGWRYTKKSDNFIYAMTRDVRDRVIGDDEDLIIEGISLDAEKFFDACELGDGKFLFRRLSHDEVQGAFFWSFAVFVICFNAGGPVLNLLNYVILPMMSLGPQVVVVSPVHCLSLLLQWGISGFAFVIVMLTVAYEQPIWCNLPFPVLPIYFLEDLMSVFQDMVPGCMCSWFPSLSDQVCDETCWYPSGELFTYRPCRDVIDGYGLAWTVMQPLEWFASALFSPWEINIVDDELTPLDRTVRSCYWYALFTQAALISIVLIGVTFSFFIFCLQLPTIWQPFFAAHVNLWNVLSISTKSRLRRTASLRDVNRELRLITSKKNQ